MDTKHKQERELAAILNRLQNGGWITAEVALKECDCWQLNKRINTLRERGHRIAVRYMKHARGNSFPEYRLADEAA